MKTHWEELVPFYVADTLSAEEKAAFETRLAGDPTLQQSVQEWRMIAAAVWEDAEKHTRSQSLPPLSAKVKAHVQVRRRSSNGQPINASEPTMSVYAHPGSQTHRSHTTPTLPLTLAAVFVMTFLFGGLLIYLAFSSGGDDEDPALAMLNTAEDSGSYGSNGNSAVSATATPYATSDDLGLLPTMTPFPVSPDVDAALIGTPVPAATLTPRMTATVNSVVTITPVAQCSVRNPLSRAIGIYVEPGYVHTVAGELASGETRRATVRSQDGWYQVIAPDGGIVGWVDGEMVALVGRCSDLPQPTAVDPDESRYPLATVNIEQTYMLYYPAINSPIHHTLFRDEQVRVIAKTPDGRWYLVESFDDVGRYWVEAATLTLSDSSLEVPLVATMPPPPAATATHTPPPPTPGQAGGAIQAGAWQHDAVIVQHDCGGEVGLVSVIDLTLQHTVDLSSINLSYREGTSFTLRQIGTNQYSGSYSTSANIAVSLTFTSPTSYRANETIVHESGCIVRSEWTGRYVGG